MKLFGLFTNKKAPDLEKDHAAMLPRWEALGKATALKGLPTPAGDHLGSHVSQITATYRAFMAKYGKRSSSTDTRIAEMERSNISERQKATRARLKEMLDKQRKHNLEQEELPEITDKGKPQIGLYIVTFLLSISEALVTKKALQIYTANNNLMEIVLLIGLIVLFCIIPHALVGIYRGMEGNKYRSVTLTGISIFIVSVFMVLSLIRISSIQNSTLGSVSGINMPMPEVKSFYLTLIQLFLLFGSVYIASKFRSKNIKELIQKKRELEVKVSQINNEVAKLEGELQSLPIHMFQSETMREDTHISVTATQQLITSYYEQAVSAFISANVTYREDGAYPDCFLQEFPKL
jgi:hypothetical protein